MYSLKLNKEDARRFKRICKMVMLRDGITLDDLAERTGYAKRTLYNFFGSDRTNRFIMASLKEELNITVGNLQ